MINIDDHIKLFTDFLNSKNLKARTIENYLYYMVKYFTFFNALTQENLLKAMTMSSFRNGLFRATIRSYMEFVRLYNKDLNLSPDEYNDILELVFPKRSGRKKTRIIKPLTEEQILFLETYLKTEEDKLKLLLSFYCGLRLAELHDIRIFSFNWAIWGKNQEAYGELRVIGKGDKEGICIVPSRLMKRIGVYIKGHQFKDTNALLFRRCSTTPLKHIGRSFQMSLRKAGISSGLTKLDSKGDIIDGTEIHPHRLRHSYGYFLRNIKRLDIRYVQELLRHSSISSTQIYTYTDKEDIKEELRRSEKGQYF